MITPLLMLAGIGVSATAFGKTFRVYALVTLIVLVASSVLTGVLAAQVNAGGSAPWFGIPERAIQGVWLQWVAVLAIVLMRARRTVSPGQQPINPALGAPEAIGASSAGLRTR